MIFLRYLIVNADDFGLHPAVNEAVRRGVLYGCIRSASLMSTGRAAREAAELSRDLPSLGVGVHLTLVAERPALPVAEVRSLVDGEGRFLPDYLAFCRRLLAGGIDMGELRRECAAQIERVLGWGVPVTHLDSHQHLHVLPQVSDVCLGLMREYGIARMRLPAEGYAFAGGYPATAFRRLAKCGLTFCARLAARKARRQGFLMPQHFFGMLAGGHLQPEYFRRILEALPEGTSEIMLHPGADAAALGRAYDWHYLWEQELDAATSPQILAQIESEGIRLISFADLK